MRLLSISLENYRVFGKKITIELEKGLTVFTGRNGTGKSSVLRGLDHFFNGRKSFESTGMGYDKGGGGSPTSHNFPMLDRTFFFDEENPIAHITCTFEVDNSDKKHLLGTDHDFEIESENRIETICWSNLGDILEIEMLFESSGNDLVAGFSCIKLGDLTLYKNGEKKPVTIKIGNHKGAFDRDKVKTQV